MESGHDYKLEGNKIVDTTVEEGCIEIHMKVNGIYYALGLKLDDFPTEEKLVRGLKVMTNCLRATLDEQGYWLPTKTHPTMTSPSAKE